MYVMNASNSIKRKRDSTREAERKRRFRLTQKLDILKSLLFEDHVGKPTQEDIIDEAIEAI